MQACSKMATSMDPDIVRTELLPILLQMSIDVVSEESKECCRNKKSLIVFASLTNPLRIPLFFPKVPNIRFNVAKELTVVAPICGPTVYEHQVSPVLSLLMEDPDRDVRFFAERTFKALKEQFVSSA